MTPGQVIRQSLVPVYLLISGPIQVHTPCFACLAVWLSSSEKKRNLSSEKIKVRKIYLSCLRCRSEGQWSVRTEFILKRPEFDFQQR